MRCYNEPTSKINAFRKRREKAKPARTAHMGSFLEDPSKGDPVCFLYAPPLLLLRQPPKPLRKLKEKQIVD